MLDAGLDPEDWFRACTFARTVREPHRSDLVAAARRGWLLTNPRARLSVLDRMLPAWRRWFHSRSRHTDTRQRWIFLAVARRPKRSRAEFELPDGVRLSDAGVRELEGLIRGANRDRAIWWCGGGRVDCHTADAELLGASLWDLIAEHAVYHYGDYFS